MIKVGDYVTRYSYNHDIVFKVISMKSNVYILKGMDYRLTVDADSNDLKLCEYNKENCEFCEKIDFINSKDRNNYFFLPGKVLHIDSDLDYLERCILFYKKNNIFSYGIIISEPELSDKIVDLLEEYTPDIVVITGHDSLCNINNKKVYKNSKYFIEAVKKARKYEKDYTKLSIIAGACQSDYKSLIKAGASFASSPKGVNIHALDPAIIATSVSLSSRYEEMNLKEILKRTKYGEEGLGGVIEKGMMYIGFPR